MTTKVTIIDYGVGNLTSITNMLDKFSNLKLEISRDPKKILKSDKIILPGVGAFGKAIKNIKLYNLDEIIVDFCMTGKSLLGICLGMQLLMESSEEFGYNSGLGLIEGEVKKISNSKKVVLPNIGFYNLEEKNKNLLNKEWFYFIHSYMCVPKYDKNIISHINYYGIKLVSEIKKNNIHGFQFHPEKSHESGFRYFRNFINE